MSAVRAAGPARAGEVLLPVGAARVVRARGGRVGGRAAHAPPGRARPARRLDQAQPGPRLRAHRHLHEDAGESHDNISCSNHNILVLFKKMAIGMN